MLDSYPIAPDPKIMLRRRVRTNLPFLRRFGRALTGDQRLADTAVLQLMEVLVTTPEQSWPQGNVKVMLYRWLLRFLRDTSATIAVTSGMVGPTSIARQAQLLHMVEGFDVAEVAEILEIGVGDVHAHLIDAGQAIGSYCSTQVLIIEDEPLISLQLEAIVFELGLQIAGVAATRNQAVAAAKLNRPGLILSDVQLADGSSGIDAVGDICREPSSSVIFITAYPERLLTGERTEPIFLITKPFNAEAVKATINQALFLSSGGCA